MTIEAMNWVLVYSTTKGAQRLVMLSLANHADERGECWPSVRRIAAEANIQPATAKRTLSALERAGHIVRLVNAAPDKRMRHDRRTNLYRLLDGGAQKCPPWITRGHNDDATGGTSVLERGASTVTPIRQENPSVEPSSSRLHVADGSGASADDDELPHVVVEAARHYAMGVVKRMCDTGKPPLHETKYVTKVTADWIERNNAKALLLLERDETLTATQLESLCSESGAAAARRLLHDPCNVCDDRGIYFDDGTNVARRCQCQADVLTEAQPR